MRHLLLMLLGGLIFAGCDEVSLIVIQQDSAPSKHHTGDPEPAFAFQSENQHWGFINGNGDVVIAPQYDYAYDFRDGLALVHSDGRQFYLDKDGKVAFKLPDGAKSTLEISEGFIWFESQDKKWGFCDTHGNIILEPKYDEAKPFSDGMAAVNRGAKWQFPGRLMGGEWGYVSTTGELVVPIQYQFAFDFSEGFAQVAKPSGNLTQFIDRAGRVVLTIANASAGDFREGLAPVHEDNSLKGKDWRTRYIDPTGETKLTVDGYGEEFHEGLAVVTVRGGEAVSEAGTSYGYIDKEGRTVIRARFGEALPFSDGLAAVRTKKTTIYGKGDSWGYIDKTGEYVIEPKFNEAKSFQNGFAKVHMGGALMEVFDAPWYWKGGDWWLIDKEGILVKKF